HRKSRGQGRGKSRREKTWRRRLRIHAPGIRPLHLLRLGRSRPAARPPTPRQHHLHHPGPKRFRYSHGRRRRPGRKIHNPNLRNPTLRPESVESVHMEAAIEREGKSWSTTAADFTSLEE